MYRVGRPGWRLAYRLGATLLYRVNVARDVEAGVYIATSPDVRGLVAEAATFDELFREVEAGADELIGSQLRARSGGVALLGAWGGSVPVPV
ncbi:MAG: DUF1902 domain-containing protein [Burkholderiaceae bacterium]|nr:MAG: DUF1902 domain-containing protein [Burkholderiaceae bacterium]